MILEDLENALAEHAPPGSELSSELPPLTIDGIPVSVDKMTQVGSRWHYVPGMQVVEFSALTCKFDIFYTHGAAVKVRSLTSFTTGLKHRLPFDLV